MAVKETFLSTFKGLKSDRKKPYDYVMSMGSCLFEPSAYGLKANPESHSHPDSGYTCDYIFRNDKLFLKNLAIETYGEYPDLNGVKPYIFSQKPYFVMENGEKIPVLPMTGAEYSSVDLFVPFTGKLLVGNDTTCYDITPNPDHKHYVYFVSYHLQPFWFYKELLEVQVYNGRIRKIKDRSADSQLAKKIIKDNKLRVTNACDVLDECRKHEDLFGIRDFFSCSDCITMYNDYKRAVESRGNSDV